MQRFTIVRDVVTYLVASSACEQGQQHQQILFLLRAMLHQAIVPGVVAHGAAISVGESSSNASRHYISYERCGAQPMRRMWATVASGGLGVASVLSGERCSARASRGCVRARCCHQRMREGPNGPVGFAAPTSDATP